jgi:hypothetical protein
MTDRDHEAQAEILERLAVSRQELRRVLDPPRKEPGGSVPRGDHDEFPRSRTMQMLVSGRGLGIVGALAGGLLIARPALALRLLRMLPGGTVARMLLLRAFTALRAKPGGGDDLPGADH